jgi:hypothetical protein
MPHVIHSRNCDHCGKPYVGRGAKYCSMRCLGMSNHVDINMRFWSKVNRRDSKECWNWKATLNKYDYGQIKYSGKLILSHRLVWILIHGEIPENMCVLHHCDNPSCCNPSHLYLGTHQDNMRDRSSRGRTSRHTGESNGRAKLTRNTVMKIRDQIKNGLSYGAVAKMFKISNATIGHIARYETWRNI